MKKFILLLFSLLFLLLGCHSQTCPDDRNLLYESSTINSNTQSSMADQESTTEIKNDDHLNEDFHTYQWLFDELKLRNDYIIEAEKKGRYPLGRPGIVICFADLNNDNQQEFFIGEWKISANTCELEYVMFDPLGNKVFNNTFTMHIDSNNDDLFTLKRYISPLGEECFFLVDHQAAYLKVIKLYYSDGWKTEEAVYDNDVSNNSFSLNLLESINITIVQVYSEQDIVDFMVDNFQ